MSPLRTIPSLTHNGIIRCHDSKLSYLSTQISRVLDTHGILAQVYCRVREGCGATVLDETHKLPTSNQFCNAFYAFDGQWELKIQSSLVYKQAWIARPELLSSAEVFDYAIFAFTSIYLIPWYQVTIH